MIMKCKQMQMKFVAKEIENGPKQKKRSQNEKKTNRKWKKKKKRLRSHSSVFAKWNDSGNNKCLN